VLWNKIKGTGDLRSFMQILPQKTAFFEWLLRTRVTGPCQKEMHSICFDGKKEQYFFSPK
jgi:hypothetical protein